MDVFVALLRTRQSVWLLGHHASLPIYVYANLSQQLCFRLCVEESGPPPIYKNEHKHAISSFMPDGLTILLS